MEATKANKLDDRVTGPILCDRDVGCLGEFNPYCTSKNFEKCPWYIEQGENYILQEKDKNV